MIGHYRVQSKPRWKKSALSPSMNFNQSPTTIRARLAELDSWKTNPLQPSPELTIRTLSVRTTWPHYSPMTILAPLAELATRRQLTMKAPPGILKNIIFAELDGVITRATTFVKFPSAKLHWNVAFTKTSPIYLLGNTYFSDEKKELFFQCSANVQIILLPSSFLFSFPLNISPKLNVSEKKGSVSGAVVIVQIHTIGWLWWELIYIIPTLFVWNIIMCGCPQRHIYYILYYSMNI
jgi:hypothetical protein